MTSKMPNGGFSLTNGSNYMLDGFHFDTEYNNGVLDGARLPEAKGLAGLPSGIVPPEGNIHSDVPLGLSKEADLNMEELTKEAGQEVNIVDHSWLASEPEPDLEGVRSFEEVMKNMQEGNMNDPEASSLITLQELWGQASTDGLSIIPNENRKNEPYRNTYSDEQSKLPGDSYREQKEKAYRKLAYGELNLKKAPDGKLKTALLKEEGLYGQVYIKASHFPGLFNGRWNEVLKKKCASCMYIVAKDVSFDRYLGMGVVASTKDIPWKKTYNSLSPKFEACGLKKASGTNYRAMTQEMLQAYLKNPKLEVKASWFPEHQEKLKSPKKAQKVDSREDREVRKAQSKLERVSSQLIEQGFLTQAQVESTLRENKSASMTLRKLFKMASKPKAMSDYQGQGKEASLHNMRAQRADANEFVPSKEKRNLVARNKSSLEKVNRLVKANLISVEEVVSVTKGKSTPEEKLASVFKYLSKPKKTASYDLYNVTEHRMDRNRNKELDALPDMEKRASDKLWQDATSKVDRLVEAGLLSEDKRSSLSKVSDPNDFVRKAFAMAAKPEETANYEGEQTAHILNGKKSKEASETEIKVSTWLRQKMSEGSAGRELDALISARFSANVLEEHASRIASERKKHEGLSGHVYVDASSYMTSGTEGCDAGALIHRANKIPSLMKTSKCGSCVFNSGGTCQKYNKVVIASTSEVLENPKSHQKEMIRLANASDIEQTSSLFVNTYDPDQFSLTASETIHLNEEAPSSDKLGDILFGGFNF